MLSSVPPRARSSQCSCSWKDKNDINTFSDAVVRATTGKVIVAFLQLEGEQHTNTLSEAIVGATTAKVIVVLMQLEGQQWYQHIQLEGQTIH